MKHLISAIQFLTRLPVHGQAEFNPRAMIPFFPMAGLIIGLLTALVDLAAASLWPRSTASIIDVIFIIAVTGALHLDGLGDSADGLYNHHDREKALSIMKDSRIGTMGLTAIICALAAKWGGIVHLDAHRTLLLVLVPAYARAGMMFGIRFLPYGRPEGTGREFFGNPPGIKAFGWFIVPLVLSGFLGWKALMLNAGFAVGTAGILIYYKNRMGCITGDLLGGMVEISEAGLFLLLSAGGIG